MGRIGTGMLTVVAVAAALAIVATSRSDHTPAQATEPDGLGPLSGVYDLLVHEAGEEMGFHHCIVRLDTDSVTTKVKTASVCYADINLDDPNAEPAVHPIGEGPDTVPGPPPPPPYVTAAPIMGGGSYDSATGALSLTSCFSNVGGLLGPNAIAILKVFRAAEQIALNGKLDGEIILYRRQGIAQCAALAPQGTPDIPQHITFHPTADVNGAGPNSPAPWRTLGDTDFDNDGCSDTSELLVLQTSAPGCGDDPYNTRDPSVGSPPDMSGDYTLVLTLSRADVCWGGSSASGPCALADGAIIPGSYYTCLAHLGQSGTQLSARLLCYVDTPGVTVNPQLAGDSDHNGVPDVACPPAPSSQCGDGLPGAAPPGATQQGGPKLFADIDDRHLVLAGAIDSSDAATLSGCWEDRDGFAALGNVYLTIGFDAHTGHGTASIWAHQSPTACATAAPQGTPASAAVDAARQALTAQERDTDVDGCSDQRELGDNPAAGGLRDPLNPYDYPDMPSKNKQIRINDVSYVIARYRHDAGGATPPFYDPQADHTVIVGSNAWNLGPGNGEIRINDVTAVINAYRQDCG